MFITVKIPAIIRTINRGDLLVDGPPSLRDMIADAVMLEGFEVQITTRDPRAASPDQLNNASPAEPAGDASQTTYGRSGQGTDAQGRAAPAVEDDGGPGDRSFDHAGQDAPAEPPPATDAADAPDRSDLPHWPSMGKTASPASLADAADWIDYDDAADEMGINRGTFRGRARAAIKAGRIESRRVPSPKRGPPRSQVRRSQLPLITRDRRPSAAPDAAPAQSNAVPHGGTPPPTPAAPRDFTARPRFADGDGPVNTCQSPAHTTAPDASRGIAALALDDRPLLDDDGETEETANLVRGDLRRRNAEAALARRGVARDAGGDQ